MYPTTHPAERLADGIVHAIGVIGAVAGTIVLLVLATGIGSIGMVLALAIYGAALIATFTASALYHVAPWHGWRPLLRRIDHAAIYLKIAGTYTPLVAMIGSTFAYVVLGIVWALAALGVTLKLFFWRAPGRFGPVLYLIMGWLSVGLIWSLWSIMSGIALGLIIAGGLIYTAGVVFYASEARYKTAIWHGFVVAASACFFAAILLGAVSLG